MNEKQQSNEYPLMRGNDPAFPTSAFAVQKTQTGLTKRELFAAMAMQAMAGSEVHILAQKDTPTLCKSAVFIADALLAELEKCEKA